MLNCTFGFRLVVSVGIDTLLILQLYQIDKIQLKKQAVQQCLRNFWNYRSNLASFPFKTCLMYFSSGSFLYLKPQPRTRPRSLPVPIGSIPILALLSISTSPSPVNTLWKVWNDWSSEFFSMVWKKGILPSYSTISTAGNNSKIFSVSMLFEASSRPALAQVEHVLFAEQPGELVSNTRPVLNATPHVHKGDHIAGRDWLDVMFICRVVAFLRFTETSSWPWLWK